MQRQQFKMYFLITINVLKSIIFHDNNDEKHRNVALGFRKKQLKFKCFIKAFTTVIHGWRVYIIWQHCM